MQCDARFGYGFGSVYMLLSVASRSTSYSQMLESIAVTAPASLVPRPATSQHDRPPPPIAGETRGPGCSVPAFLPAGRQSSVDFENWAPDDAGIARHL